MDTSLPVVEEVIEKLPSLLINEKYLEPTIQGEGVDIGKPCFFLRTHLCPTRCPSCDTNYSWDGTEKGIRETLGDLTTWLDAGLKEYPGCGLVITGGEPLIHYRNEAFRNWIMRYSYPESGCQWVSIETSGFLGKKPLSTDQLKDLVFFLRAFNTVHLSPKITDCLHGEGYTDEELLINVPHFLDAYSWPKGSGGIENRLQSQNLVLKFVVKTTEDVDKVVLADKRFGFQKRGHSVYLMPWGNESAEIIEACKALVPICAKYGFILTPRLHSVLWGRKRGI